jgi:autotransporter-associated beta strand protein
MKTPVLNPFLGKTKTSCRFTSPLAAMSSGVVALAALVSMQLLLTLPGAAQAVINTSSMMSAWSNNSGAFTPSLQKNTAGAADGEFTIPTGYGSTGMLVVTIAGELNGSAGTPIEVKWGGTPMALAKSASGGTSSSSPYSGIYYLANPASGTGPLVVTYSGNRFSAYAVFATGVSPIFQTSNSAVNITTGTPAEFFTNTPASITPTANALAVVTFGAAPSTTATTTLTTEVVTDTNTVLSSQVTPPKAPNANSSAASGCVITSNTTPIKGRTTTNLGGSSTMTIAVFDPAPPPVYDNLLVVTPSSVQAGTPFDVDITARDSSNQIVNNSTTIVVLTSPSTFMEFDWNGNGTFGEPGDNIGFLDGTPAGTKIVQARNKKAETTTITATGGGATTTTSPITTTAGAYTQLQILAPGETAAPGTTTGKAGAPSIASRGTPFNVTVNAVDSNWNVVPSADPEVAITSTDTTAALPPAATISANSSSYSVTLGTVPGPFTVTATDTGTPAISATTPPLTVYGDPLTWVGDNVANLWDLTSVNWSGVSDSFSDGSQVTFGESGSKSPAVSIPATVSPVKMTVSNSSGTYTFEGVGSIAGTSGGFTKSAAGTVILSTANTYTGLTTLSGGVLIPTVATALPSTSALTISGGLIGVQDLDFTRLPGLAAGQVNLVSGGFAAFGTTGVVNLGGNPTPAQLTMGTVGFFDSTNTLSLSHVDATRALDFQNPIALRNGTNFFQVADSSSDVDAILSGVISAPFGGSGLSKTGDGTLMLTNTGNSFNQSFIDFGTIKLGAANVLPDGATFTVKRGGASGAQSVIDLNGFSDTLGTLNLGDGGGGNSGTPSVINSDVSTPEKAAAVLSKPPFLPILRRAHREFETSRSATAARLKIL